jgi:succinoglycan biosynthesis protein ExoO
MPAFNVEGYIRHSIESVLVSGSANVEVLVVDDCSTDDTAAIVGVLAERDARVRLMRLPENQGPSAARNIGVHNARGTYIAFVDADDLCVPGRLEYLLRLANAENADIVTDNLFLLGENADTPWSDVHREYGVSYVDGQLIRPAEYIRKGWVVHPILRRDRLLGEGLLFDQRVDYGEDYILYTRLLMRGWRWVVTQKPLYYQRSRLGSLTRSHKTPELLHEYLKTAIRDARAAGHHELAKAFGYKRTRVGATVALRNLRTHVREGELGRALFDVRHVVGHGHIYLERISKRLRRAVSRWTAQSSAAHQS